VKKEVVCEVAGSLRWHLAEESNDASRSCRSLERDFVGSVGRLMFIDKGATSDAKDSSLFNQLRGRFKERREGRAHELLADDACESVIVGRVARDVKPLAVEVIGAAAISFLSDATAIWLGAAEGDGQPPTTEPEGSRPGSRARVGIGDGGGGESRSVDPSPIVGKRGHLGLGSLEACRRIDWQDRSVSTVAFSNRERREGTSTDWSVTKGSASAPAHKVDAVSVGLAEHDGKVPVMAGLCRLLQSSAIRPCVVPVHAIVVPEAKKLLKVVPIRDALRKEIGANQPERERERERERGGH
jgi:hypothetical protein